MRIMAVLTFGACAVSGSPAIPTAGAVSNEASCVGQHAGAVAPLVRQDFGSVISDLGQAGAVGDLTPSLAHAPTDECPPI